MKNTIQGINLLGRFIGWKWWKRWEAKKGKKRAKKTVWPL